MKKKTLERKPGKLTLHRETLMHLTPETLRRAAGGSNSADSDCVTTSTELICPPDYTDYMN